MLVAAFRKFKLGFPLTLSRPDKGILIAADQLLQLPNKDKLFSSRIFPIKFKYLRQAVHTKVLKIVYGSGETIYKVRLGSAFSKWNNIWWLQRRLQAWVIVLGREPDEKLKSAITAAIEYQELTNNSESIIV